MSRNDPDESKGPYYIPYGALKRREWSRASVMSRIDLHESKRPDSDESKRPYYKPTYQRGAQVPPPVAPERYGALKRLELTVASLIRRKDPDESKRTIDIPVWHREPGRGYRDRQYLESDKGTRTESSTNHYVPSSLEDILQDRSRPHDIALQHLKQITDNFSDERILGKGGFGVVYKGLFQNGDMIAVKKITSSLMPGLQKQFENEVYHLMTLKHPNIVRCVGYCYEIKNECLEYNGKYVFAEMAEKLLCLEYLRKGSLDKYISGESAGLDWSTRYKIIEGICYGLLYLHEQIDQPIIHLDLKPANILLDDSFIPKITDFGLSRQLDQQKTIWTSTCDGTFGYMAPEFLHGGTITPKSDIFSLGVIIMEVVMGHRDYPDGTRESSDDFIKLTLEKWRNVLQGSPEYGSLETYSKQIERCMQVGLSCVNTDRTKRPTMTEVITMLRAESTDCHVSNEAVQSAGQVPGADPETF